MWGLRRVRASFNAVSEPEPSGEEILVASELAQWKGVQDGALLQSSRDERYWQRVRHDARESDDVAHVGYGCEHGCRAFMGVGAILCLQQCSVTDSKEWYVLPSARIRAFSLSVQSWRPGSGKAISSA